MSQSKTMEITLSGGKRVEARYGDHVIRTDQTVEDGGEDSAPAPFDLFLASLGTCAGFYVQAFCSRRDIPTDGIRVVQRWEKSDKGRLERVELDIVVPDDFPAKYRTALIRVASKCAVKRALLDPPEVEVRTVVE